LIRNVLDNFVHPAECRIDSGIAVSGVADVHQLRTSDSLLSAFRSILSGIESSVFSVRNGLSPVPFFPTGRSVSSFSGISAGRVKKTDRIYI
jgi:hypothetical protein